MNIDVKFLPEHLGDAPLAQSTVVVFDVLRATSSIASALAVGVSSIHAFASLDEAKSAAAVRKPRPILCGEIHTLKAPGFDLGNSPGQFNSSHAGKEIYLATTNGTKALAAARQAAELFAGSLLNAKATADVAAEIGRDVILVCSGTDGQISLEDSLGAGAVCEALMDAGLTPASDTAWMAKMLFDSSKSDLPRVMRNGHGGHNIIRAGLEADIDFCARLNVLDVVAHCDHELVIRKRTGK